MIIMDNIPISGIGSRFGALDRAIYGVPNVACRIKEIAVNIFPISMSI